MAIGERDEVLERERLREGAELRPVRRADRVAHLRPKRLDLGRRFDLSRERARLDPGRIVLCERGAVGEDRLGALRDSRAVGRTPLAQGLDIRIGDTAESPLSHTREHASNRIGCGFALQRDGAPRPMSAI